MPGVDGLIRWEGNGETLWRVLGNLSEFLEYVNGWYRGWKGGGFTFVIRLDIVGRCSCYLAYGWDDVVPVLHLQGYFLDGLDIKMTKR